MSLLNQLIGYYGFDEIESGVVRNMAPEHPGAGNISASDQDIQHDDAKMGGALVCTGGYFADSGHRYSFTGSFSVSLWARRTDQFDSDRTIGIFCGVTGADASDLGHDTQWFFATQYIQGTDLAGIIPNVEASCFSIMHQSGMISISGLPVISGQWQHLCATYDACNRQVCFYRNGELQGSSVLPSGCQVQESPDMALGGSDNSWWNWVGYLDELALWERVLNPSEVEGIFNAGVSGVRVIDL